MNYFEYAYQIHNCILQPDVDEDGDRFQKGRYAGLADIFRKCISRLKYIIADSTRKEVLKPIK